MAAPVKMPKIGLSDESSIIAQWHKRKGDPVKKGDVLFTIETDKSTFDVVAEDDGTILEIFYGEGEEVPVFTTVCVIGNPGEDIAEFVPNSVDKREKSDSEEGPSPAGESGTKNGISREKREEASGASVDDSSGRLKISPRAKNLAEKAGVDYRLASPSGPEGRIIERDIQALIESGFTASAAAELKERIGAVEERTEPIEAGGLQPDYEVVNLTNIRKIIANNMHKSLSTTAQLTLHASFDASDILAYREKIKANKDKLGLEDITLNDIILYAVSRTLMNHRELNAHLVDEKMLVFKNVHLGVAVDTERGLMVPTVFYANQKSLNELSREVKELVEQCRKGTVNPDKLKGGTFTVTNLGTLGIETFTPILNPPQTGILGVGSIVYRVKKVGEEFVNYPSIGLSLTFDHRALDGAPAARFLKELKDNLENFSLLLAK
ncbi:MAG: dihydrolipoamide acetyltransferase family protein [Bacillota bacterium]